MADEVCLARAVGYGSIKELIDSPWSDLCMRLQLAFLKMAVTEKELIFIATEWLVESVPRLQITNHKSKSPIIASWCIFLANIGCQKCDVVLEYEDAVRDRSRAQRKLPCYGYSIGLIQVGYDRKRAEAARSARQPGSVAATMRPGWNRFSSGFTTAPSSVVARNSSSRKKSAGAATNNRRQKYRGLQKLGTNPSCSTTNPSLSPGEIREDKSDWQSTGKREFTRTPAPGLPEDGDSDMSRRQLLLGSLPQKERKAYLAEQSVTQPNYMQSGSNALPLGVPNRLKRGTSTRPQSRSPTRRQSSASRGPPPKRLNLGTQGCGNGAKGRLTPPEFTPRNPNVVIKRESSFEPRPTGRTDADNFLESLAGQLGARPANANTLGACVPSFGGAQASPMAMNALRTALPVLGSPPARLAVPNPSSATRLGTVREIKHGGFMPSQPPLDGREPITPYETEPSIKQEPNEDHPAIERLFQNRPKTYVHAQKRNTVNGLLQHEAMASLKETLMQRGSPANAIQGPEQHDAPASETVAK